MSTCYNPSLSQEPRNQPMKVVPQIARESFLGWLERVGRLKPHELDESHDQKFSEDLDEFLDSEIQVLDEDDDEED